jgi:DNA polymerase V
MTRGGVRAGAGRKKNSGLYQEETKPVRLPVRHIETVKAFLKELYNAPEKTTLGSDIGKVHSFETPFFQSFPFYDSAVSAGFPSPADDHISGELDLNHFLISRPTSTFFVRVSGDSMVGASIQDGDVLVVDRSLEPKHKDIVIAVLNGELTVKTLIKEKGTLGLKPENPQYPIIHITEDMDFKTWGVVTSVIHKFRGS